MSKRAKDNPTITRLTAVENRLTSLEETIKGKDGVLVRLGKIEKELQMHKWFVPTMVAIITVVIALVNRFWC